MYKTLSTKKNDIRRQWHLVDAKDKILGRLSSQIAQLLIGKFKPYYVSYLDCGDHVVVVNANKVMVSGKKLTQKIYMRYSGYPGGLTKKNMARVMIENPTRIIREAVSGMLPNNKLRDLMLKRLYIHIDDKHKYTDKFNIKEK